MTDIKKKALAFTVSIALSASVLLSACGEKPAETDTSAGSGGETAAAATTTAAENSAEEPSKQEEKETAAPEEKTEPETEQPDEEKLEGSPWVTSIETGNLPKEKPDIKDDLYAYSNYEYLSEHQDDEYGYLMLEYSRKVRESLIELINDKSKKGHDLEQLRIFYDQASDTETLKKQGLSELKPYLDMIDSVSSIEEFNELLASDDFPFSPFIEAVVYTEDAQSDSAIAIYPNLILFDPLLEGGQYYNDHDDEGTYAYYETTVEYETMQFIPDFAEIGFSEEETTEKVAELAELETTYAKYVDYDSYYADMDYGELAKSYISFKKTKKEAMALCPDFPLEKVLKKLGKDDWETYLVATPEWLPAFNDIWTEDNLEKLKLMAKAKLFEETRYYRDPTNRIESGYFLEDEELFAYEACNSLDTFANVLAKLYVDECIGKNAKERLSKLTQDIIGHYKELIKETEWLDESSRDAVIEKLDNMALNILEPNNGYIGYSELELTPTEDGGTLLGNYLKLKQYRIDKEHELVSKSSSRESIWYIIAPTMDNCFYDVRGNSINIYPGFVTPLYYTDDMDETELMSGIGFVIAHEICHGMDFNGSQFDANGSPKPMFTDEMENEFVSRTEKLADYISTIEVKDGIYLDGKLVIGETAADLSGFQALLETAEDNGEIDFDRFFEEFASKWAHTDSEDFLIIELEDVHPPFNVRINVIAQMFEKFYDELGVSEGDGMYLAPEDRIILWGKDA